MRRNAGVFFERSRLRFVHGQRGEAQRAEQGSRNLMQLGTGSLEGIFGIHVIAPRLE